METFDEKKLLKDISEGDEKAFEVFFLHYYPRVKGFVAGLLQSQEEAEDVSQDIFFMLWNNRSSLANVQNIKPYLFRVCKNVVYRNMERMLLFKNYQQKQSDKADLSLGSNQVDDELHFRELELLVEMVVEKMPSQRKRIYKLSREIGMNNEEIAQNLNINKRTVENHITQALADIRKVLFMAFILFF